jgi:hypothetical protein
MINKFFFLVFNTFSCLILASGNMKTTIYIKSPAIEARIELSSNGAEIFYDDAVCDGVYLLDRDTKIFQMSFKRPRWGCFEKSITASFDDEAMEQFYQGKVVQAFIKIENFYSPPNEFLATMQMN